MKKIIIIFALIFAVNIPFLYAQYGDYYDGKNSYSYGDMPSPCLLYTSDAADER